MMAAEQFGKIDLIVTTDQDDFTNITSMIKKFAISRVFAKSGVSSTRMLKSREQINKVWWESRNVGVCLLR